MLFLTSLVVAVLLSDSQAFAQDCPSITVTSTAVAGTTATASPGTSLVVKSAIKAVVESCAQAFVSHGGTATGQPGATITASGNRQLIYVNPTYSYYFSSLATASMSGGYVPTASIVNINVMPSATATVGPNVMGANIIALQSAVAVIEPGATQVTAIASGIGAQVTMLGADSGQVQGFFGPNFAQGTFTGTTSQTARGSFRGTAWVVGSYVTGLAEQQGHVTISGDHASCSVGFGGACTIYGDQATATAYQPSATVALIGGSGGSAVAMSSATVTVVGAHIAMVSPRGSAHIGPAAQATISGSGQAFIQSGSGDVYLLDGATGTLELGATVFAAGGFTIVAARAAGPSGLRRRAQAPLPSCGALFTGCLDLHGSEVCVNVKTDIFNCGGCALQGVGFDCTTLEGAYTCVDGRCTFV